MLTTKKHSFPHTYPLPDKERVNALRINLLSKFDNNRLAKVRLLFELANYFRVFFFPSQKLIIHSDRMIQQKREAHFSPLSFILRSIPALCLETN